MATTQCFITAFDASGHPPPLLAAIGLIFVAIAVLLLIFRKSEVVRLHWHGPRGWQTGFAVFMLCFAVLWTALATGATVQDWWTVNYGSTQVVEGVVEQFHPMPFTGHDTEHFVVNGVRFDYSDYEVTSAFNQTSSHGGPIRAGLLVRIHYVDLASGPRITRLEVPC